MKVLSFIFLLLLTAFIVHACTSGTFLQNVDNLIYIFFLLPVLFTLTTIPALCFFSAIKQPYFAFTLSFVLFSCAAYPIYVVNTLKFEG